MPKSLSMETFIQKIREAYPLSDEAIQLLIDHTERVVLPRRTMIMREGTVAKYTYLVISGFARGFIFREGRDITIWFASEGMSLVSMNGYMFATAGYENVELMEDCDLLKISNETLNRLFDTNTELANWGRRMSDGVILKLERLFMERYYRSANERYNLLLEREPEIFKKVPLKHIASFLGISQVSLSRIRAGVQ